MEECNKCIKIENLFIKLVKKTIIVLGCMVNKISKFPVFVWMAFLCLLFVKVTHTKYLLTRYQSDHLIGRLTEKKFSHFKKFGTMFCDKTQVETKLLLDWKYFHENCWFILHGKWACLHHLHVKVKVKWSRYRPGVAQRVGRGIALLFHDSGTRRGWVVSSTLRPHFFPGKDPVPILQEAGWAPGPVWMGGKSCPHRDSFLDRPAHSLSYPVHKLILIVKHKYMIIKYLKFPCIV